MAFTCRAHPAWVALKWSSLCGHGWTHPGRAQGRHVNNKKDLWWFILAPCDVSFFLSSIMQVPTTLSPTRGSSVIEQSLVVEGHEYKMTCVSMGNPHAVTYSMDGKTIKVMNELPWGLVLIKWSLIICSMVDLLQLPRPIIHGFLDDDINKLK